jgi:hypothetical protein
MMVRAIADDGVAARLQRQQERGLPCAGVACDDYSRHSELPSWVLATPNGLPFSCRGLGRTDWLPLHSPKISKLFS